MTDVVDEIDLYEVLGISNSASKDDIRKAYRKAALSHHPDKAPEDERPQAEIRFKAVQEAYEILYDDDKRHLYDTHGMAAFDGSRGPGGMGPEVDMDDILNMFMGGMGGFPGGMGGMGGMPGMGQGGRPRRPRKGANEVQDYEVTLQDMYKGKTTKFASTKNVVCTICKGTGGKDKAKPHQCGVCGGKGVTARLRTVGPGLVTQETAECGTCHGAGEVFKDKDRCKKCKGARVVETRKVLELYIPPGSKEGDKIILTGEADQLPNQEPGDIIFDLKQIPHDVFERNGSNLKAEIEITLAEALTGFNRVVLQHLDGRGIALHVSQPEGKILKPGQVLKVPGEGMPLKRSDAKGDLYLVVKVVFPEDGWLKDEDTLKKIRAILPPSAAPIKTDVVDEVEFDDDAKLEDFEEEGGDWEDDDEDDGEGGPQCATQ